MVSSYKNLDLEKIPSPMYRFVARQYHTESQPSLDPSTPTTKQTALGAANTGVGNSATDQLPSLDSAISESALEYNASLHTLDTTPAIQAHSPIAHHHAHSPSSAGLRVQTDLIPSQDSAAPPSGDHYSTAPVTIPQSNLRQIPSTSSLPARTPSVKAALHASSNTEGSLSPSSAFSSPGLGPMVTITPLPSPIVLSGSPGSWKRLVERSGSRGSATSPGETVAAMPNHEVKSFTRTSPRKRRGVLTAATEPHGTSSQAALDNASSYGRNRSLSEYVPEAIQIPRPRHVAVSGSGGPPIIETFSPPDQHLHREQYLAVKRGLAVPIARPPTPPRSNRSGAGSDDGDSPVPRLPKSQIPLPLYYEACTVRANKRRRWRAVRQLGKGTFSEVMLATSQGLGNDMKGHEADDKGKININEEQLDPRTLVAVKVVEHGPAGGATAERVETSLKRELEILKSIRHPSLVHLKAFSMDEEQALLVLSYCAGGDLFELASLKHDLLIAGLIRRIFAELVAAVRYLHAQYIVHRDIKLESMPHLLYDSLPRVYAISNAKPSAVNQMFFSIFLQWICPLSPSGSITPLP